MNWYTIFYFFSLADKISATSLTIAIITSIIAGVVFLIRIVEKIDTDLDEPTPKANKFLYMFAPFAFAFWLIWAFTPEKKDMLLIIAGGSVGQFISTDENAKELPGDITRFLRSEILEATANSSDIIKELLGIETEVDKLKSKSKEELIKMLSDKEESKQ